MQTYFEKIMNGTRADLTDELEKAIRWAHNITDKEWTQINNAPGGLRRFIRETMERPATNQSPPVK